MVGEGSGPQSAESDEWCQICGFRYVGNGRTGIFLFRPAVFFEWNQWAAVIMEGICYRGGSHSRSVCAVAGGTNAKPDDEEATTREGPTINGRRRGGPPSPTTSNGRLASILFFLRVSAIVRHGRPDGVGVTFPPIRAALDEHPFSSVITAWSSLNEGPMYLPMRVDALINSSGPADKYGRTKRCSVAEVGYS